MKKEHSTLLNSSKKLYFDDPVQIFHSLPGFTYMSLSRFIVDCQNKIYIVISSKRRTKATSNLQICDMSYYQIYYVSE